MDLRNNRAGRTIGNQNINSTPETTASAVQKAVKNGESGTMKSPPKVGGGAGGNGDPHMTGFDGKHFRFDGEAGKKYALFGRENGHFLVAGIRTGLQPVSKTSAFVRKSYFGSFGLQVGGSHSHIRISMERLSLK